MCELLGVYQRVLDTISDLPLVPMVLWRHRGRLHYLPRPRWLLRYFVVRHVDRMLASLGRRYSARAALGWAADGEQQDREAVREFQQSLPPTRQNTYFVLLIVAIVVLYRPIIDRAVTVVINATEATTSRSELRQQVLDTVEKVGAALSANFTSVNQAVNAVLNEGFLQLAVVMLGLTLSSYVVLRPFVPGFRLKRMLFNLAPEPEGRYRSAVALWSVPQATGLYERERRLFEELGGRPLREFPFDLVVSALAMVFPLFWCSLFFRVGVVSSLLAERIIFLTLGACLLILALVRLGWLYRIWQRRQLGRSGPYMPFEVRIRGGRAVAKVERPLGIRMLFLLLVFVFIVGADSAGSNQLSILYILSSLPFALLATWVLSFLVSVPWWHRVGRELRNLDHSYDTRESSSKPRRSLHRRIQRAQARAGQPVTLRSAWVPILGLLLPAVLFAYWQHELNKVWAVEGEPLDPWPADTSRKVGCSTGIMPWLKGLTGHTTEPAGPVAR